MGNFSAILRDFSSSNNNSKWEISSAFPLLDEYFTVLFHANGNCKDNEGYVSIIFSEVEDFGFGIFQYFNYDEIRCCVSVVDVGGNKRFTQSIVFIPDEINNREHIFQFGWERYVKRETLLNDPAELLPDDCLAIWVDFDFYPDIDDSHLLRSAVSSSKETFCVDEKELFIPLDSDFGRELCRVSKVFRFASDRPMKESRTRKMPIPKEEWISFRNIWSIFRDTEDLDLSFKDICDLYRIADKYDIQPVIKTCKQFVNAILRDTDNPTFPEYAAQIVPAILELAENYGDDDLKETVQTYLKSKENFGTEYDALGIHLKGKLQTEWQGEFQQTMYVADSPFRMSRRIIEPEFQFYQ